jgi:hypothetical protein
MPRPTVFTPSAIVEIRGWVDEGLIAAEIAERIGCSLGTLRVRCSQLHIPLRRPRSIAQSIKQKILRQKTNCEHTELTLSLPNVTIDRLRQHAALRGTSEIGLAATLLEAVAQDSLYDAVLDEN